VCVIPTPIVALSCNFQGHAPQIMSVNLACGAQTRFAPIAWHLVAVAPVLVVLMDPCVTVVRVFSHVLWQPMHLAQIRMHAYLEFVPVGRVRLLTLNKQERLALQTWIALLVLLVTSKCARPQA